MKTNIWRELHKWKKILINYVQSMLKVIESWSSFHRNFKIIFRRRLQKYLKWIRYEISVKVLVQWLFSMSVCTYWRRVWRMLWHWLHFFLIILYTNMFKLTIIFLCTVLLNSGLTQKVSYWAPKTLGSFYLKDVGFIEVYETHPEEENYTDRFSMYLTTFNPCKS